MHILRDNFSASTSKCSVKVLLVQDMCILIHAALLTDVTFPGLTVPLKRANWVE